MAATQGKRGISTQFLREVPAGSATYAEVAEVKTIGGPSMSRDPVDATHLQSPNDYAEFIPGLKNGGEVALTLNFRPDHVSQGATAGLHKAFEDGTVTNWQIAWPQFTNTPKLTFPGFLTGWEPSVAPKDMLMVAVKIKVTGPATPTNFA